MSNFTEKHPPDSLSGRTGVRPSEIRSQVNAPEATDMERWIAVQEELAEAYSEGASLPLIQKAAAAY